VPSQAGKRTQQRIVAASSSLELGRGQPVIPASSTSHISGFKTGSLSRQINRAGFVGPIWWRWGAAEKLRTPQVRS